MLQYMLQYSVVGCIALQCVEARRGALLCVLGFWMAYVCECKVCCSMMHVLQYVAVGCCVLQWVVVYCSCSVLRCVVACCSV